MEEREFTISRKNYSGRRECVVITRAQGLHFFFLPGKEEIFISLIGDVVDVNIM